MTVAAALRAGFAVALPLAVGLAVAIAIGEIDGFLLGVATLQVHDMLERGGCRR